MSQTLHPEATGPPEGKSTVYVHRAIATIRPEKVEIRPARSAAIGPLIGVLLGALAIYVMVEHNTIPMPLLVLLLLFSIFVVPLSAMALVYALIGASVVADSRKQSVVWQQGVVGLGVGTRELVPFGKIDRFEIEDEGGDPDRWRGSVDSLAQLQVTLVKSSGKRLRVASVSVPRWSREEGLRRAQQVGHALASMTSVSLVLPENEPEPVEEPVAAASVRGTRKGRPRVYKLKEKAGGPSRDPAQVSKNRRRRTDLR